MFLLLFSFIPLWLEKILCIEAGVSGTQSEFKAPERVEAYRVQGPCKFQGPGKLQSGGT